MGRTANASLSRENEAIIKAGYYVHPLASTPVILRDAVDASKSRVCSYDPASTERLLNDMSRRGGSTLNTRISVTSETTSAAAARLATHPALAVLNFASARNPGGGYLGGATAQEEDVCRSSALYTTLLAAPDFYAAHKTANGTYSHRVIWSPDVPVYRDPSGNLLESFHTVNFVTAAAPNVASMQQHGVPLGGLRGILKERAARILAVCASHGAKVLVLGAWGCGVFRNDPAMVAGVFKELLEGVFKGVFEEVVFAIYDTSKAQLTMAAFAGEFAANLA